MSAKHSLTFGLRLVGAIIVPIILFRFCEEFFYHIVPWTLWTYRDEGIIGMIASGFFAGNCFSGLVYCIAPRWKVGVTSTMSCLGALLVAVGICAIVTSEDSNWLHVTHHAMAILGMGATMMACRGFGDNS